MKTELPRLLQRRECKTSIAGSIQSVVETRMVSESSERPQSRASAPLLTEEIAADSPLLRGKQSVEKRESRVGQAAFVAETMRGTDLEGTIVAWR